MFKTYVLIDKEGEEATSQYIQSNLPFLVFHKTITVKGQTAHCDNSKMLDLENRAPVLICSSLITRSPTVVCCLVKIDSLTSNAIGYEKKLFNISFPECTGN